MSYAECGCGRRSYPFGRGGGAALAVSAGIPLLAEIPFEEPVVEGEDRGAPPVLEHPDSAVAIAFGALAREIIPALGFTLDPVAEPAAE